MKHLFLLFFVIAIFLLSCKKSSTPTDDNSYTIHGIVADWDAKTIIGGAKVYVKLVGGIIVDSAIADANGRVSFTYKKEGGNKFLTASKPNYLVPPLFYFSQPGYNTRTDSVFLARPSFVNATVHKAGVYLPLDTIDIQVQGDYTEFGHHNNYRLMLRDKADAPDKIFNLQAVYGQSQGSFFIGSLKLYFKWDIIRNGNIISTKTDSAALIRHGTQNFNLNY